MTRSPTFSFQKSTDFAPMTAAERQQRCRENGKGRHRGYRPTKAQRRAYAAAVEAEEIAEIAAAAGALPPGTPLTSTTSATPIAAAAVAAPAVTAALPSPIVEWNLSTMAA